MPETDYKQMFDVAEAELQSLQVEKENLELKLADVKAKIEAMATTYNALAPLVGAQLLITPQNAADAARIEALKAAGISLAIRSILDKQLQQDFTAAMMRDRLAFEGWDWGPYANPLSTIHTTLMRLAESGAAKETTTKEGKKAFYSAKRVAVSKAPPPFKPLSRR